METSAAGIRYKRETTTLVRRFKGGHITFPACVATLDAALAEVILTLDKNQLPALRELMMANNAEVIKRWKDAVRRRTNREAASSSALL